MVTVRLKPALESRLEALARRTGHSKSFYAALAIEEHLPVFERDSEVRSDAVRRDAGRIQRAISSLKQLRRGVTKPPGMTVRSMREEGRR